MPARLALVVVGTLVVLCTPRVARGSDRADDRCDDAVRDLRATGRRYEHVVVDPAGLPAARAHRADSVEALVAARAAIELIPAAKLDDRDPAIVACLGELGAWTRYLEALDGQLAAAATHARVIAPFLAQVRPLEPSLRVLLAVAADPAAPGVALPSPGALADVVDDLARVDGACVGVPAAARAERPGDRALPVDAQLALPATWCRIAAARTTLALAYLGARAYTIGPAGLGAAIEPWYRAAGLPSAAHGARGRAR